MIVNPDKFQVILFDKSGSNYTNIEVKIKFLGVKLLEVHIDKWTFNHGIIRLSKTAGNQLNALIQLSRS